MTDLFGAPALTPEEARRKLTALKRKRASRHRTGPCSRCGGNGGWEGWPGFTCFRCGGHSPMHFEHWTERYWPTPELELQAAELEDIIRQDDERKAREAAAIAQAEQRERDHAAAIREDAWRAERAEAPHLGTVGARLEISGEVVLVRDIETQFGPSLLVLVKDARTGALVKTFGTGQSLWSLKQGDRVEGHATVKDHEVYQGQRQTVVTRAKLHPQPQEDAP